MTDLSRAAVILMAHPDDAEILMGGTMMRLVDAGVMVHCVIASLPDHPQIRWAEAAASAALGGFTVEVLKVGRDGWQAEDIPNYQLVGLFDRVLDVHPASTVFTHAFGDAHADHRHVATAATAACRDRTIDLYTTEIANQYAPPVGPIDLTTYCDITDYFERKMELLACHRSQVRRRSYREHLLARARYRGDAVGSELAEAFSAVRTRLPLQ